MNKYKIKNCPAISFVGGCQNKEVKVWDCQDCTDCVMKCIKSKLDYFKCYINNDNSANLSKMNEIIDSTVQLLDIEECE